MADDKTSETGLWIDDATGKVVKKQPKGGATQLVRPGGRITAAVQARIDSIDADPDAEAIPAHEVLGNPEAVVEDGGAIQPVTSDAVKPAAKRTRKASK